MTDEQRAEIYEWAIKRLTATQLCARRNIDDDTTLNLMQAWHEHKSEWLPLENAPRDGIAVDLWVKTHLGEIRMTNCAWLEHTKSWYDDSGESLNKMGLTPLYFRHIPEGPK